MKVINFYKIIHKNVFIIFLHLLFMLTRLFIGKKTERKRKKSFPIFFIKLELYRIICFFFLEYSYFLFFILFAIKSKNLIEIFLLIGKICSSQSSCLLKKTTTKRNVLARLLCWIHRFLHLAHKYCFHFFIAKQFLHLNGEIFTEK